MCKICVVCHIFDPKSSIQLLLEDLVLGKIFCTKSDCFSWISTNKVDYVLHVYFFPATFLEGYVKMVSFLNLCM